MLLFDFLQKYDIKNRCHVIQEFESHNLIRILDVNVKSADFQLLNLYFRGLQKVQREERKICSVQFCVGIKGDIS